MVGYMADGKLRNRISNYEVWALIHYLDSPTDYREYISRNTLSVMKSTLIMLDSEASYSKLTIKECAQIAVLLLVMTAVGSLLYFLAQLLL